jgi:uncharacterized protein YgfB (UPF0149 family)
MSTPNTSLRLPNYQEFMDSIAILALPISASELHGVMCGYLCAGAISDGEAYLRALMTNKKDVLMRVALFGVYAVSQQQMLNFDFEFQLLLPDDEEPLVDRARAFSEWCEGFTQGLTLAGVGYEQLQEDEAQEALQHLIEFAQLDYHSLSIDEDDERALMEVVEYARMAALSIHGDLLQANGQSEIAH